MLSDRRKTTKKFRTIYADPPWPEFGGGKVKRGADKHYPLMSIEEIINMSDFIDQLSDENCHLYLWTTNNFLPQALCQVIPAWGFTYVTTITWVKNTIGLGQYYRGMTEHCLFAKKGHLPIKESKGKRQQGVTVCLHPKRAHSSKPDEVREAIEIVSHPPRIELFARERYEGWEVWGNEANIKPIKRRKTIKGFGLKQKMIGHDL